MTEEDAVRLIRVTLDHAKSYRQNISQFNTADENSTAERCACAASNTAWFILKHFGFSSDQIKGTYILDSIPDPG